MDVALLSTKTGIVLRALFMHGVIAVALVSVSACSGGGGSSDEALTPVAEDPQQPLPQPPLTPEPEEPNPEPDPQPQPPAKPPSENPSGPEFTIGTTLISPAPGGTRAFYRPPSPLPGNNGDVLWAKQLSSSANGRIWQVLYRSESIHGTPVAVSGWLAVPNSERPADGYPVMAFAHGTTGLADQCAPTRRSTPGETIALLDRFLARGFVVAATDYEGLGTPGLHPYLIGPSEARGVLDSARAAQRFGGGGNKLVLFGHSQGGHAAIMANEIASSYAPEFDVVGTIGSGSGVFVDADSAFDYLRDSDYKGYLVMAALAQNAVYGDAESPLSLWLTSYGIEASRALDHICIDELASTYGPLDGSDLFVKGAPRPMPNRGENRNLVPGLVAGESPLLLIHGRYDKQIPEETVVPWVEQTCARGQQITLQWFNTGHRVPYEDPDRAAEVIIDWLEDRFAGRAVSSSCGRVPRP